METVNWSEKIRAAVILGTCKGLRVERGRGGSCYFVHTSEGRKFRFPGAARMIVFIENYSPAVVSHTES